MRWLVRLVMVVVMATPSSAFPQTPVQRFLRVRGTSPDIVDAIEQATNRSSTFKQLVTTLDSTDGIVYVHYGECRRNVLACLVLVVTQAGPYRILQVKVDPRRKGHDLMVSIGHELKHALELLNESAVVNHSTAHNFYERIGRKRGSNFETQAAVEIGLKIDGELRHWAKSH